MDKLPKKIYLQYHGDGQDDGSPVNSEDVTWSLYQEFENDIEYRLASHFTALESEVTRLKEENARLREATRWIPVSERLPEKDQTAQHFTVDVLITDGENISEGYYSFEMKRWCSYHRGEVADENVTHWMKKPLLPAPPEVEP